MVSVGSIKYTLDINFNFGEIGIKTQNAKFDLKIPDVSNNFEISREMPKLDVKFTYSDLKIDLSKPFSEIGLMKFYDLAALNAEKGRRNAENYIEKKVQEGRMFAKIEQKIPVFKIIGDEAFGKEYDFNVDLIPKSRPEMVLQEGKVYTDFVPGDVKVNFSYEKIKLDYKGPEVNIFMERNPYIKIRAVPIENKVDVRL